MIEAKKDSMRQCQEGITKVGFAILHEDIPGYLAAAALGKRYYLVLVDADVYDESEGDVLDTSNIPQTPVSSISEHTEKSEGVKIRERACILCKEARFQDFCMRNLRYGYNYGLSEQRELSTKMSIHRYCNIKSRSELTTDKEAQQLFKALDNKFSDWKFENNYSSNLEREYV